MKKILFACDLDNTLIHSYKYKHEGDVCIEYINGKEQSYISKNALNILSKLNEKIDFVPITTRSLEQFRRIIWPDNCKPQYVITTNGGNLLVNNNINCDWYLESSEYIALVFEKLISLRDELLHQNRFIRVRIVDDAYLFAYCKDGININEILLEYKNILGINVIASGKKIYFFPNQINKGHALIRLKKVLESQYIIAAGDSSIDMPMFKEADLAIVPTKLLANQIDSNKTIIKGDNIDFAIFLLQIIEEIVEKED